MRLVVPLLEFGEQRNGAGLGRIGRNGANKESDEEFRVLICKTKEETWVLISLSHSTLVLQESMS